MDTLPSSSIDIVITSPPYNIGKDYVVASDDLDYPAYYRFSYDWICEIFRLLKNGGRFAVNLPENKMEPIHHKIVSICLDIGFKYVINVLWYKKGVLRRTAWGSWKSCSAPMILAPYEYITVFYKGNYKRDSILSDITSKEFIEYTYGWWDIGRDSEDHPAAFPEEVPYRLLKLFSSTSDIVLDPFLGSGTTAVVANRLGRKWIGIELNSDYCSLAEKRIQRVNNMNYTYNQREIPEVL